MAKNKIYVVKKGHKTGIFENVSWDIVKTYIDGYSGALYKGFTDLIEAKQYYLDEASTSSKKPKTKGLNKGTWDEETFDYNGLVAFTDGSNLGDGSKYSFGLVVLIDGKIVHTDARKYEDAFIAQRNVAGELKGAIAALTFAKEQGVKSLKLCYDYAGIEFWANGTWKANKELPKQYIRTVEHFKQFMDIEFIKVPAHENVRYNEQADVLAKTVLGIKAR